MCKLIVYYESGSRHGYRRRTLIEAKNEAYSMIQIRGVTMVRVYVRGELVLQLK
jgi:hypothetical protein